MHPVQHAHVVTVYIYLFISLNIYLFVSVNILVGTRYDTPDVHGLMVKAFLLPPPPFYGWGATSGGESKEGAKGSYTQKN